MRPVGTVPGMEGERIKKNEGEGEFNIYHKNFCKCHNVSLEQ
jgi:hypothetical protein